MAYSRQSATNPSQLATNPSGSYATDVAQNALTRWLKQQKMSQKQFTGAEQPLQQAIESFRPGGGFGAGQNALLEDEARRAQANALAEQVASGMSSGSLATSTGLRVASDLSKAKLGVEDTRTQFLNQALQALSGLRSGQAQTTAQVTDPVTAPFISYLSGAQQSSAQLQAQQMSNQLALTLAELENKNKNTGTYASLKF